MSQASIDLPRAVKRPAARTSQGRPRRLSLRSALHLSDLLALTAGILVVAPEPTVAVVAQVVFGMGLLLGMRLHRIHVAESWMLETVGILRISLALTVLHLVLVPGAGATEAIPVGAATMAALLGSRATYRAAVRHRRATGELSTDCIVVGLPGEADHLLDRISDAPQHGYRVVGVVGPRAWQDRADVEWLGEFVDLPLILAGTGVRQALVETAGLPSAAVAEAIRSLDAGRCTAQISTALPDVHHHRVRLRPFGRQSLLHLDPTALSGPQQWAKRAFDIVVASLLLLVLAPLLAVVAFLVWVQDGGPALYSQERVGRHGRTFRIHKFRSMVVDADARLAALREHNARTGPLFKMADDPRITQIGRILRGTSIDELPQLWNVVRGDMSLVGPRPALADEVSQFDRELTRRLDVMPGLTGLWQVYGRDEADFEAYRSLDLFYVRNWSLALDLAIVAATPLVVLRRALAAGNRTDTAEVLA